MKQKCKKRKCTGLVHENRKVAKKDNNKKTSIKEEIGESKKIHKEELKTILESDITMDEINSEIKAILEPELTEVIEIDRKIKEILKSYITVDEINSETVSCVVPSI